MASLQFAATQRLKVMETGETVDGGGLRVAYDQQLRYLVVWCVFVGTFTTEKLRVKLFTDAGLTALYATSQWSQLSSITNLGTTAWLGKLRFDFASEWLRSYSGGAQAYYVGIESSGYTRNGDSRYISFMLDWQNPINTAVTAGAPGIAMEVEGDRV